MSITKQIHQTINEAFRFIASQQQADGCFLSDLNKNTTFYTSLILATNIHTKNEDWCVVQKRAADFVLSQCSELQTINYWARNSNEYITNPYPDDIDDTFVAMQGLYNYDASLITEKRLAMLISLLLRQEVVAGGPYKTWITSSPSPEWQDVDVVANSNVASFLSLLNINLPPLQKYFEGQIINKTMSKYYDNEIVRLYFIAQAITNKDAVIEKILLLQSCDGTWDTPLHTALAVSALIRFNKNNLNLLPAIHFLLNTAKNGQWSATNLYIETIGATGSTYSSCNAYISVCCVAALSLYINMKDYNGITVDRAEVIFIKNVKEHCLLITDNDLLSNQLQYALSLLAIKDPQHEIQLLSYKFYQSLFDKKSVPHELPLQLAIANTLGWIGYSIYDRILDRENCIVQLPLANVCIEAMTDIFHSVLSIEEYTIFKRIISGINEATLWEHTNCTIISDVLQETPPDYNDLIVLAKKSLGHALGPILICCKLGELKQAQLVEEFFIHYLIAKQLNDDAHDWVEDLSNGFINSVSTRIINYCKTYNIEQLQEYFWNYHIDEVVTTIFHNITLARNILKKVTAIADVTYLDSLLTPLEQSSLQAKEERNKTKQFLHEFQKIN